MSGKYVLLLCYAPVWCAVKCSDFGTEFYVIFSMHGLQKEIDLCNVF